MRKDFRVRSSVATAFANIAVEFAARHPGCISGLVLIEPLPRDPLISAMRRMVRLNRTPPSITYVS
jgi:pimeloyl-ACP methyl ester carboxylesterase